MVVVAAATMILASVGVSGQFADEISAFDGLDDASESSSLIRLHYAVFNPLESTPLVPSNLCAPDDHELFIVQFHASPTDSTRAAILRAGARIYKYLADCSYIVRATPAEVGPIRNLASVRWVGPYHPAYKLNSITRAARFESAYEGALDAASVGAAAGDAARDGFAVDRSAPDSFGVFNIQVFERGPRQKYAVANRIRAIGGRIDHLIPDGFLLRATLDTDMLLEVLRMNEVAFVDPWGPPELDMDLARLISGADAIESSLGFNGQGVRGEVMDTSIRTTHVDFQDPPPLPHGPLGTAGPHGTSVYGCVFGTGVGNSTGRGVLPGAEAKIIADFASMSNRYTHTAELVDPDGPYRAVFQTNSWGGPRTNLYTTISMELDDIAMMYDFVICQTLGNWAGDSVGRPQGWSKNIVSVGGTFHYNTLDKSDDRWAFGGSTGPASDGRIKPELTHFYDQVFCPTSTSDTSYNANFGGSSAATAITAGYIGLFHQLWHEEVFDGFGGAGSVFESRPHLATMKSLLIATSEQYEFPPLTDLDRFRQGWGMIDGVAAVRDPIEVIDESIVLRSAELSILTAQVLPGEPRLKIAMVFTDPPGLPASIEHRINDLDLLVRSPSGAIYRGNVGLRDGKWSIPGGESSSLDPVECVFIEDPEPGRWTIGVRATEINEDGHLETPEIDADFGLTILGASNLRVLQHTTP